MTRLVVLTCKRRRGEKMNLYHDGNSCILRLEEAPNVGGGLGLEFSGASNAI